MNGIQWPRLETRRRQQLRAELLERARVWLRDWKPRDDRADFAAALFDVAARLSSEVTERLDRVPEKTFRGFLDWLGVRGVSGHPARMPVVFTLAPGSEATLVGAGVQLQASAVDPPVVFETEKPLMLIPGALAALVAADPAGDAFYLPPATLLSVEPPKPSPTEWRVKARAAAGSTRIQLEPEVGLELKPTLLHQPTAQQYRVVSAEGDIAVLDRPLAAPGLDPAERLVRLTAFDPFRVNDAGEAAATETNLQEHALYIGSENGLNIEVPAAIEIVNGAGIPGDATWSYWGKASPSDEPSWLPFSETVLDKGRFFLWKPAGAIEVTKVDDRPSRWIRATRTPGPGKSASASSLKFRIGCQDVDPKTNLPRPWPPAIAKRLGELTDKGDAADVKLDAFANTAPLVLNTSFFPFGREPRQFDAFYIGSKEAFSKPHASVTLDFTMDDEASAPMAAVGLREGTEHLIFGISGGGSLLRISDSASGASEPTLSFLPSTQPPGGATPPIGLTSKVRPGTALFKANACVSAAAGAEVWLWTQTSAEDAGSWRSLGFVSRDTPRAPVETLLARNADGTILQAFAICDGKLLTRDTAGDLAWEPVTIKGHESSAFAKIVPVLLPDVPPGEHTLENGLAAVTDQGLLFILDNLVWRPEPLGGTVRLATDVYPLLVRNDGGTVRGFAKLAATGTGNPPPRIVAFTVGDPPAIVQEAAMFGASFDFVLRTQEEVVAVFAVGSEGSATPALWDAFSGTAARPAPIVTVSLPVSLPPLRQGPAGVWRQLPQNGEVRRYHLFPADRGGVDVGLMDTEQQRFVRDAIVTDAALFEDDDDTWATQTGLLVDLTPDSTVKRIVAVDRVLSMAEDGWALVLEAAAAPREAPMDVRVYRAARELRTGTRLTARKVRLASGDLQTTETTAHFTWSDGHQQRIIKIDKIDPAPTGSTARTATLEKDLPEGAATVQYQNVASPDDVTVRLRPAVHLEALPDAITSALAQPNTKAILAFPDLDAPRQPLLRVFPDQDIALLRNPWPEDLKRPEPRQVAMFASADVAEWKGAEPPRPRNPHLSWEYWDGSTWWQIPGVDDQTGDLVTSGPITFCVPDNLQPTDVAGRPSHWIRARLMSGDYGEATVVVDNSKAPRQTITRDLSTVRPPHVLMLKATYAVCCAITPDVVLTTDAGITRDQTDANSGGGVQVEHFVSLSQSLAQWSPPEERDAPPGRALYLGFDADLKGGPISLLFLVDERDPAAAEPLRVEVLRGHRFEPVVAEDGTRGLSESGVISFDLAAPPTQAALFGDKSHAWIRVRPHDDAKWMPRIRAAYLNAVWTSAAETHEVEILGSSNGEPSHRVFLGRTPVLTGSLELRVMEPIGDEEVEALQAASHDAVTLKVGGRDGRWVRWREVADPDDEAPGERVYALDDETGEIRFGDGEHGRVPPIGRDNIVAVRYQTGGGARANNVKAWSEVAVISPVQGVQGVFPPEGAAGGSDPQDEQTHVRFAPANQMMRTRALTLRDLELLALQSSPDIAQVRAIPRRATTALVVIMKGATPTPSRAVVRELRRYLADKIPPSLAADGALTIEGPDLLPIRLRVAVTIAAIEFSGQVARDIRRRLLHLLDPATGGLEGVGWPLGALPPLDELAATLDGIDYVEELLDVRCEALQADGTTRALPRAAASRQLVQLTPDDVVVDTRILSGVDA